VDVLVHGVAAISCSFAGFAVKSCGETAGSLGNGSVGWYLFWYIFGIFTIISYIAAPPISCSGLKIAMIQIWPRRNKSSRSGVPEPRLIV
jgi:hypothetical protein